MKRRRSDQPCDRGAASILGVTIIVLCLVGGAIGIALAELAATRAKVATAADLAALAGASHAFDLGPGAACAAARGAARRNGSMLTSCRIEGADVVVTVRADAPPVVAAVAHLAAAQPPPLRAQARAGPSACEGLPHGSAMCQSEPSRTN